MSTTPLTPNERAELERFRAMEQAREDGAVACQAGRPLEENPHGDPVAAEAWASGWAATDLVWCVSHFRGEVTRLSSERERLFQRVGEIEQRLISERERADKAEDTLTRVDAILAEHADAEDAEGRAHIVSDRIKALEEASEAALCGPGTSAPSAKPSPATPPSRTCAGCGQPWDMCPTPTDGKFMEVALAPAAPPAPPCTSCNGSRTVRGYDLAEGREVERPCSACAPTPSAPAAPPSPAAELAPLNEAERAYGREVAARMDAPPPPGVPAEGEAKPLRNVVACIVVSGDQVLLGQRAPHLPFPGRWCIPGGKVEAGEDPIEALRREMREECGIGVDGLVLVGSVELPGVGVRVTYYGASFGLDDPSTSDELVAFRWCPAGALPDEPWGMPADVEARALIQKWAWRTVPTPSAPDALEAATLKPGLTVPALPSGAPGDALGAVRGLSDVKIIATHGDVQAYCEMCDENVSRVVCVFGKFICSACLRAALAAVEEVKRG